MAENCPAVATSRWQQVTDRDVQGESRTTLIGVASNTNRDVRGSRVTSERVATQKEASKRAACDSARS